MNIEFHKQLFRSSQPCSSLPHPLTVQSPNEDNIAKSQGHRQHLRESQKFDADKGTASTTSNSSRELASSAAMHEYSRARSDYDHDSELPLTPSAMLLQIYDILSSIGPVTKCSSLSVNCINRVQPRPEPRRLQHPAPPSPPPSPTHARTPNHTHLPLSTNAAITAHGSRPTPQYEAHPRARKPIPHRPAPSPPRLPRKRYSST